MVISSGRCSVAHWLGNYPATPGTRRPGLEVSFPGLVEHRLDAMSLRALAVHRQISTGGAGARGLDTWFLPLNGKV
jgi:hypothetical protein